MRVWLTGSVVALTLMTGCQRPVLIPDDSPVRIGPGVTGRAYTLTGGDWRLTDRAVAYPEGWYVVPLRFVNRQEFEE